MSLESAKLFIERMKVDGDFEWKFKECQDENTCREYSKEAGMDFTVSELQEAMNALNDSSVDNVAGVNSHQDEMVG